MNLIQLFKRLRFFVKPYHKWVMITLFLTLIGSFMAQVNAYVLRYTVDELALMTTGEKLIQDGTKLLIMISVVLLVKELVYALVQYGQKFFGEKLRIYVTRDISQLIVERILTYRMAFYTATENESGKLQTRIDLGVSSLTRLVRNLFIDIFPLFANAIIALIAMFIANVYVGLVSVMIIPIYFYVSARQADKLGGFRRSMRDFRESKNNRIIGLIESITVIKSFNREKSEAGRHEKIQFDMTENQMKTRQISFLFDGLKSFLEQFGLVAIIILTVYLVLNGSMTVGAIMFHVMLFANVSAPIRQLQRIYDEVNDAIIYSEGFFEILDAENQKEPSGTYIPEKVVGNFTVKDVEFTYPNGVHALNNVSFTVPANTITALVGLSGAGKSTLVNLLDKFYEPNSGEIFLDGVDLQKFDTQWLRDNIGLVLQRNHIFNDTVSENIRYGNQDATHEEIVAAAKKAYIHEQIMNLPKGYDSKADQLSGGQQQRISIARLFLKNPPIIILDEPTASLDAIATQEIKKSLDAIKKDRTVIIISHSISQIIDAENVVVLKQGTVIEQGTHDELYKNESTYYEIFNALAISLNIEKISETIR